MRGRIDKKESAASRLRTKTLFKANKGLKDMTAEDLVVLIADAITELEKKGGHPAMPGQMRSITSRVSE